MTDLLDSIRRHRGIAVRIARSWAAKLPRSILREDLEQSALIGLYLWKRAHPDETHEGWLYGMRLRIRGSIQDELRRQDWLPRKERHANSGVRVLGFEDVAPGMEHALPSAEESAVDRIERNQTIAEAMLAEMGSREAQIIRLHYFRGETLDSVAQQLNTTPARVSQLHARALNTMCAHVTGDTQNLPRLSNKSSAIPHRVVRSIAARARTEESIPRATIARLRSEGKTARQAAVELGCSPWLVEREYTRLAPIAKARPR